MILFKKAGIFDSPEQGFPYRECWWIGKRLAIHGGGGNNINALKKTRCTLGGLKYLHRIYGYIIRPGRHPES